MKYLSAVTFADQYKLQPNLNNELTGNDLLSYSGSRALAGNVTSTGVPMSSEVSDAASVGQSTATTTSLLADAEFLDNLRSQMYKFASLQLSDPHLAEDAVQEALIGALKNAHSFGGRAALKTWVFAILKNKIADTLRQKQRVINVGSLLRNDEEDEDLSALFNKRGFWQPDERPIAWGNPEESVRSDQFWIIFETCLNNLPGIQGRVFMMREFIELDSAEICTTVGITVSNLNVSLHRARLRLRECLENRWFAEKEKPC